MVGVSVVSESEQPLWLAQVITECGFHVGLSIPVTTRATRNSCLIMIKIIVTMIMKLFDFQLATPTQICLLIIIEIFNYLVQQLTLEVEMNVSNSIHILFRVGHLVLADMYNINIQASASLSQSVLIYYTVLIHYYPLWPGTHHSSFDTMTY